MDFDFRAAVGGALQINGGVVYFCRMLDNRKPKSRSAKCLGVAFIYAVKALKYAFLFCRGNTDAGIRYCQQHVVLLVLHRYCNASVFAVIFNGIVAKIIDNA